MANDGPRADGAINKPKLRTDLQLIPGILTKQILSVDLWAQHMDTSADHGADAILETRD